MVGINELGTGTREKFLETYSAAVDHIKELQPNAIIFIQGILYVTEERSAEDEYINNLNIQLRNMVFPNWQINGVHSILTSIRYIPMAKEIFPQNIPLTVPI